MSDELKRIKKIYGEEMMHLCRELFPTILEEPGKLLSILQKTFAPSHQIAQDVIENDYTDEFSAFIFDKYINTDKKTPTRIEIKEELKTPQELLREKGYTLYQCHNEEEIQSFKKYYANGEELCTFLGGRLYRCHVFFAIKDNADDIKREDYRYPDREDDYSTSVLSIQFARGSGWNSVSIKSRYNHSVINPDATYGNNLDRIVPGLSRSFSKHYKYRLAPASEGGDFLHRMKYTSTTNGMFYRYNHEKNGIYYCDNNIIIDHGRVIDKYKDKERFIFMDEYILDRKEKKLIGDSHDGFIKTTMLDDEIIKTDYFKQGEYNAIIIYFKNNKAVMISTNKQGEIVYYGNYFAKRVYEKFLPYNDKIRIIDLPKVRRIDRMFMSNNDSLIRMNAPLVREIFNDFLSYNQNLIDFNANQLRKAGERFLIRNPYYSKKELLDLGYSNRKREIKIKMIQPKKKYGYMY